MSLVLKAKSVFLLSESIISFVLTNALLTDEFSNYVEKIQGYFKATDACSAFLLSRRISMFSFWISRASSCLIFSHLLGSFPSKEITYSAPN